MDHPPPAHWQDFEDLCLKLWRPILPDAKKNGRGGQPQAGVDIFGRHYISVGWWGIQCKQRSGWPKTSLSTKEIEDEVREAEAFEPPLSHFIIATTAPRDATAQKFVRHLNDHRLERGLFTVDLTSWDDLVDRLYEEPSSPLPMAQDELLQIWLDRVVRNHQTLLPYFQRRNAPLLEHVYVELQLDFKSFGGATASGAFEALTGGSYLGQPLSIRQVLDIDPATHPWVTRRWLLRGDPGSGKTTLLRHLALTLAEEGGKRWVPVYRSLPRLMREPRSLFEEIERDLTRADLPGVGIRQVLQQKAAEGRLLLLVDGLDEVPKNLRGRAETLLSDLAARWQESPILVTSRPIGAWSPGLDFRGLEVLPFDSHRRRAFLAQWFGRKDAPDIERGEAVAGILEVDRNLRELASNPLYLTLLALLVDEGGEPAHYRPRLFDQIFDLLEEGRHHKPPTPIENRALAHQGICLLAYRLTEENRDAEAVEGLEHRLMNDDMLREPLRVAWPRLRVYLEDVAEKTGIFGAHDGPEADWRFWHRTFREALTAEQLEKIYQSAGRVAIVEHARGIEGDMGRWAEPYALLAGRVPRPDALVMALIEANRGLGLRALATAQGLDGKTLRRILELSENWWERAEVYERVPELIGDPLRALGLLEQLRQGTRNGNDLFFLERAARIVSVKWPEAQRATERLCDRLYDHIPPPPEDIFRWIDTPIAGKVEFWRQIPLGSFWMGSLPDEEGGIYMERQRKVVITSSFRMAVVPITVAQFSAFDPEHCSYSQGEIQARESQSHPVNSVTWYQAYAFCRWLSVSLPWAQGARLPTEEEWEYCCNAETYSRYWKGDLEANLDSVGWYEGNSDGRTHRVGEKPCNAWGLFDIHGNVLEWTASKWRHTSARVRAKRVVRGGSFRSKAVDARSSRRFGIPPDKGFNFQGFRVCLPSDPELVPKPWPNS